MEYAFLQATFFEFLESSDVREHDVLTEEIDSQHRAWGSLLKPDGYCIDDEFLRNFGFEPGEKGSREFRKRVINPFKHMTFNDAQNFMNCLNFFVGPYKGRKGGDGWRFKVEKTRFDNALEWLWVDAHRLGLKGLELFVTESEQYNLATGKRLATWGKEGSTKMMLPRIDSLLPFQQCYYCGNFPLRSPLKFCHVKACRSSERSTGWHPEGCCWGDWERKKASFKGRLKRASSEKVSNEIFKEFLKERLEVRLKPSTPPIQTRKN